MKSYKLVMFFFLVDNLLIFRTGLSQRISVGIQASEFFREVYDLDLEAADYSFIEHDHHSNLWTAGVFMEKQLDRIYFRGSIDLTYGSLNYERYEIRQDSTSGGTLTIGYQVFGNKFSIETGGIINLNSKFSIRYGAVGWYKVYYPYSQHSEETVYYNDELYSTEVKDMKLTALHFTGLSTSLRFDATFAGRIVLGVGLQYGIGLKMDGRTVTTAEVERDGAGNITSDIYSVDKYNNLTIKLDETLLPSLTLGYRFGRKEGKAAESR